MKIAVTGASGFIGGELVQFFSQENNVIALKRNLTKASTDNVEERKFDLTDESTFNSFNDAEVLVHCAFIKFDKSNPDAYNINVQSALKLAGICEEKSIHFIFLSTMSAHADALSQYGKHKFDIERKLNAKSCTILKLGLVMGSSGGLFNSIRQTIQKSSVIPLVDGGNQPIQVIHVLDLCRIIEKIAEQKITGTYNIGSTKVYALKYMYECIAASQNKKVKFISLPFGFMKFALSIVEALGINLPVNTENLLGLKQLKAFDTKSDLDKLGIELMNLEDAVKVS